MPVPIVLRGESKAQLAESGLTVGWLVETLVECNPEFKQALGGGTVEQVDTKDVSEGEGYASRVYKVTLELANANASEYCAIMKVPTSAKLGKLQEDLSEQMKDGLRNISRHFAALHAYHICADEEQRKRIDAVPTKCSFLSDNNERIFEGLLAGIKEAGEDPLAGLVRKLKPASSSKFMQYVIFDRPKELGIPPLLCQGDSGGHNVFFKKAGEGTLSDEVCAFLDWQAAFKGNPFYDIAKYVVGFSDADVRRELEIDLVEDYYMNLKEDVEKHGGKVDFGVEQLREAYELCKVQSALVTLAFISFLPVLAMNKMSPDALEALREKALLRAKFVLSDTVDSLKKYAPQYLAE